MFNTSVLRLLKHEEEREDTLESKETTFENPNYI